MSDSSAIGSSHRGMLRPLPVVHCQRAAGSTGWEQTSAHQIEFATQGSDGELLIHQQQLPASPTALPHPQRRCTPSGAAVVRIAPSRLYPGSCGGAIAGPWPALAPAAAAAAPACGCPTFSAVAASLRLLHRLPVCSQPLTARHHVVEGGRGVADGARAARGAGAGGRVWRHWPAAGRRLRLCHGAGHRLRLPPHARRHGPLRVLGEGLGGRWGGVLSRAGFWRRGAAARPRNSTPACLCPCACCSRWRTGRWACRAVTPRRQMWR